LKNSLQLHFEAALNRRTQRCLETLGLVFQPAEAQVYGLAAWRETFAVSVSKGMRRAFWAACIRVKERFNSKLG
jgi:hypothetical protein